MGKIARTWSLMSACWQVLLQDKSLLVFPLVSCVCCVLVAASFAIPIFVTDAWHPPGRDAAAVHSVLYYGTLAAFYFCNYFVATFFNSAIVWCAAQRMTGGNPTVGDGLRAAGQRLPVIIGWALVAGTVGMVLRIVEERSEKVGRIVAGLLGMGWTLVTFLVVPILVLENKGPFAALKDSTAMLKRTWGEQVVSNLSFSTIFFVLMLPGILLIVAGIVVAGAMHSVALAALCVAIGVIYLMVLALVQSALHSIFQTALYLYARDGQVPAGFHAEALSGALGR